MSTKRPRILPVMNRDQNEANSGALPSQLRRKRERNCWIGVMNNELKSMDNTRVWKLIRYPAEARPLQVAVQMGILYEA